ncbi:MAG: glycosyltransferase [Gemmatimonadaceae bacterium]|jgi:glycosyltransferase involved in cell wall biosynthesis|nr:glycosyltransferase [Gemmatimonadaceae bacterium]
MAPERVALFLPDLGGGGAEQQLLTLAGELARDGLAVDLVVGAARGALCDRVPTGVTLHVLGAARILAAVRPLARFLRAQRPAALLATLEHANVVAVVAAALAGGRTRVVLREANVAPPEGATPRPRWLSLAMRVAYPLADAIVAVSEAVGDAVARDTGVPRRAVHVIYNPVLDDGFGERLRAPVTDPWLLEAARSTPVVLGVGRLAPQKDFATLVTAVAEVAAERPVRLVLMGEGEERAALEALASALGVRDHVRLAGFVPNPLPAMRDADVFVLPSRWEGLPGALVQAVAAGARVIATDCPGGSAEVLDHGAWGTLVPVGDAAAMACAIAAALQAPRRPVPTSWHERYRVSTAVRAYRALLLGERAA